MKENKIHYWHATSKCQPSSDSPPYGVFSFQGQMSLYLPDRKLYWNWGCHYILKQKYEPHL